MEKLISKECVDFVKSFEGFEPTVKNDMVGVPTLGYGMTGKEIKGIKRISESDASRMLESLLNNNYALPIKKNLDIRKVKLKQNEFDALVSMAYNIGVSGLLNSTLYKNVCSGNRDRNTITSNFRMWSMAGGKTVEGLLRRRTEEAKMFFKTTKVNYCLEFQKFYNKVTQTSKPLTEDGAYGPSTEKSYEIMNKLIRSEY